jgi:serine/threonine protein phosphatase PrpC
LSKSLRLLAAELTDVGRRRERNQDNVIHVIPSDADLLEEKGALFVVCDGMGGHAAGEVAAELGVSAIREGYYALRGVDVVTALAQAVDQANQRIYRHAREHPELSGMGTTCVALAVVGGRAYFVNIGDSRGYLIRDGHMRQVTRDHSWVAEQVRVGVLTPEQARTHMHRNVITRSLGTQPNVTADLFVETLRDGDRVLLCSDGLHGYVDEHQIEAEILRQDQPEASVHHLVDMANANGGPDNITAIVVHLLQVPEPAGDITLPMGLVASPAPAVETAMTQPMPMSASSPVGAQQTGPLVTSSGPAVAVRETTQPVPAATLKRGGRSRSGRVLLSLVAVLVLAVAGAGAWYVGYGRNTTQSADHQLQSDIASAQQVIKDAPNEPPAQALAALAQVRTTIETDLQNGLLDAQTRQQGQALLSGQLEPAVRAALQSYNSAARVTPVTASLLNCTLANATDNQPLTNITGLAAVNWSAPANSQFVGGQLLYVAHSGALYQAMIPAGSAGTPNAGQVTCAQPALSNIGTIAALASDGGTLYTLSTQSSNTFAVNAITSGTAGSNGLPAIKAQSLFTTPTGTTTATLLAAQGTTVYVSYTGGSGTGAGVWIYDTKNTKAAPLSVALPKPAASLVVSNGTLYLLLNDGSLAEIDGSHHLQSLAVSVLTPVQPADPNVYSISTPVPTPVPAQASQAATPSATPSATTGGTGSQQATTLFPTGSALTAIAGTPSHLLVGDSTNMRVVGLSASSAGPGIALTAQFVYGAPGAGNSYVVASQSGSNLNIFTWNGASLEVFTAPISAVES